MNRTHYHVAGVAGVGMSALAQALLAAGFEVSGSDRFFDQGQSLEVLDKLRANGVRLVRQDGSGLTPETAALVYSTAVEESNPELVVARKLGIPLIHRAAMLAELARGKEIIAVTGTAGKTTVCGMLGWIFECLGEDPTVVNGGAVLNWQTAARIGNIRAGGSTCWILEADESDRSLMSFEPEWAILTNISKDHFELEEVSELFCRFAARVKRAVICGGGSEAILRAHAGRLGLTLPELVAEPLQWAGPDSTAFQYKGRTFHVPLPGRHNAENAFAAVAMCDRLGKDLDRVQAALEQFKGMERRLQRVGEANGISVLDDYAHNPAKIRAAWLAVAPSAHRIHGVWRPHGYGPLKSMFNELVDAFGAVCRPADRLFILPVFYAGGTASRTVTSEVFVEALCDRGVAAIFVPDYPTLEAILADEARKGDAILAMGARDPELPLFARRMIEKLEFSR